MGQPFVNKAKLTFKFTDSAERCDWFKLMHVMPYFLSMLPGVKRSQHFSLLLG